MKLRYFCQFGAPVAAVALIATQAAAGVTVGNNDGPNCYPFSCGPTDGLTEYQEDYNQGAFSGPVTFSEISFTENVSGQLDTGTYAVSFYLSTQSFGNLSGDLASNEGTFLGTLGTFNLSGAMPYRLTLSGSSITYDPSLGNLLMDVTISNGSSYSGVYNSFFDADYTGSDVTRAWYSNYYGSFGDETGGLQTTFGAVPEPAAWALMVVGLGGLGGMMRAAKRRESLSAASA